MTTPAAPVTGAPGKALPGPKSPADWLKTREGKIVAGGAAVLLVVVLALRRNAGGGGISADQLQGGTDGTQQAVLDQLTGRGGSLDELTGITTELAGRVEDLTEQLVDNPIPTKPTTPSTTKPLPSGAFMRGDKVVVMQRIGEVGKAYDLRTIAARYSLSKDPNAVESTLRGIIRLNPSLAGKRKVPGGFPLIVADPRYYKK